MVDLYNGIVLNSKKEELLIYVWVSKPFSYLKYFKNLLKWIAELAWMIVIIKDDDLSKRFPTPLLFHLYVSWKKILYVFWKKQKDSNGEQRWNYSSGCEYLVVGEAFHYKGVTRGIWGVMNCYHGYSYGYTICLLTYRTVLYHKSWVLLYWNLSKTLNSID